MKKLILTAAVLCPLCLLFMSLFADLPLYAGTFSQSKQSELDDLDAMLSRAKKQVSEESRIHAGDFLQLLPSVSVSRRSPYEEISNSKNETYISLAVNSSQLWNITDRCHGRETLIALTLRKIDSCGFLIRKLIDRKYLYKDRLWKMQQIRSSLDNPVEMAAMDEKIDEMMVKVQECEIEMEKTYAEIEFAVEGAGR